MDKMPDVAVTYVSQIHASFFDNLYDSGLTFERGQTRAVPALLAHSLLRHTGEFELAAEQPKPARIGRATFEPKDDTKEVLEATKQRNDLERDKLNERQNVVDSVHTMDKDALKGFAQEKYGQVVPKTLTVENMRVKVVALIDQFGLV